MLKELYNDLRLQIEGRIPQHRALAHLLLLFFLASCRGGYSDIGGGAAITPPSPGTVTTENLGTTVHTVRSGETLFSIARKYYGQDATWVDVNRIRDANGIPHTSELITVGQQLVIPGSVTGVSMPLQATETAIPDLRSILPRKTWHVVQKNQNLYWVALTYEVDIEVLMALNDIDNPMNLEVDSWLYIPELPAGYADWDAWKAANLR